MTDRQKIELIKRETRTLASELTAEEQAFLERDWDSLTEADRRLYYTAWKEKPGTMEHAAYNTGCSPAEIAAAAKVVRAIRNAWTAAADTAAEEFDERTPAGELLEVLERAAEEQPQPKRIEKKILPQYFDAVKQHRKTFELRKDDSDYQCGDILILREWDDKHGKYTGRSTERQITYILRDMPEYGLKEGYCILAIQTPGRKEAEEQ